MLRIKEAIAYHNRHYKPKVEQKDLAVKMFPNNTVETANSYLSNWVTGRRLNSFKVEHIEVICEVCKVDANFIFGRKPMRNKDL